MNKSIFVKYFVLCAVVVIVSITLLGAIMMLGAAEYFKNDKYGLLKKNAQYTANYTVRVISSDVQADGDLGMLAQIKSTYLLLSNAMSAQILLVDTSGNPQFMADSTQNDNSPDSVDATKYHVQQRILAMIGSSGEYFEVGKLGGAFKTEYYIYGTPVKLADGTVFGYLFIATPATAMMDYLLNVLQIFCLSSVIVIFLAFAVFYVITMQMARPLRRMAYAAKKFGSGDFSERLEVVGEDEIAELAAALNNMAQSLSILEQTRRSFVANVSHELRTPMTTIAGFVDGVLDGTIPKEKEREYLTIVSEEVKRLSRLVRSMLNMSRIETGEIKIQLEDFDVLDVILQTLFSFETAIEDKNVNIEGLDRDKVIVEADRDLIHQVVYNLVENAVKFVNSGGTISFGFRVESNRTYIKIRNSGAGLSKEEVGHVFERFYKSDKSRGLDKNGVGLGLYIVRSIIALHDGEITVSSREGEYCEFEFYIPSGKMSKALKKSGSETR